MITDSFGPAPGAIVEPGFVNPPAGVACGRCVVTFSAAVAERAPGRFPCREIARVDSVGGPWPIYLLEHRGVPAGSAIVPTHACRDEGLSYHGFWARTRRPATSRAAFTPRWIWPRACKEAHVC